MRLIHNAAEMQSTGRQNCRFKSVVTANAAQCFGVVLAQGFFQLLRNLHTSATLVFTQNNSQHCYGANNLPHMFSKGLFTLSVNHG